MTRSAEFKRARDYAFRLLAVRSRSTKEVRDKLRLRKVVPEIISEVLEYLAGLNYLNDSEFCRQWIVSRLNKSLGLRRIRYELRQKGVPCEIIEKQLGCCTANYAEEDIVRLLIRQRLKKLAGADEKKAKVRVYAFLARRGFSPEIISEALSQL